LLTAELLQPGRKHHGRGELFEYDLYCSTLTVTRPNGTSLFIERLVAEPWRYPVRQVGVMGKFDVFANVIVVTPTWHAGRIFDQIAPCRDMRGECIAGASHLPNDAGLVYKVLGMETEPVKSRVRAFWDLVRREVVGVPATAARLWGVTGDLFHRVQELKTGLLAATARFGAYSAVIVPPGMSLALVPATPADGNASLQQQLDHVGVVASLAACDPAGGGAHIGAVHAQPDAPGHVGNVLLAQVVVGIGGAGLGAVAERVDGGGKRADVDVDDARVCIQHLPGVAHGPPLKTSAASGAWMLVLLQAPRSYPTYCADNQRGGAGSRTYRAEHRRSPDSGWSDCRVAQAQLRDGILPQGACGSTGKLICRMRRGEVRWRATGAVRSQLRPQGKYWAGRTGLRMRMSWPGRTGLRMRMSLTGRTRRTTGDVLGGPDLGNSATG
jgi:hypothetical protein